jgi:hypothetical protein
MAVGMTVTKFGRYQVAEPPSALLTLHHPTHLLGGSQPKEVDWEPKIAVLDQEDLFAQGIDTSVLIKGAQRVDALGSCTAQANVAALSNVLPVEKFVTFVETLGDQAVTTSSVYTDVVAAERAAIGFYHACTDQTGDPGQEWPPTDCGSSGPFIVSEDKTRGYVSGGVIASGADSIVSLLQKGGILIGQPFLNAWMQPAPDGFIDGNGSVSTIESQIRQGVAGGHETYLSAIEKLVLFPTGVVDPWSTVIRLRNSWNSSWGDHGSYRAHLSTFSHILGAYCDFRQLVA